MRNKSLFRISAVGLVQTTISSDQENFIYPAHICRVSLDALPQSCGIYVFRDAQQRPLYIGKSVKLRSRVLAHLRNAEEARMLQLCCDVQFQRTAGEIGALLLESALIKQYQPPFNVLLREQRSLCSLRLLPLQDSAKPAKLEVALASKHDFARSEHLYGLFSGKTAALKHYRQVVEEHQLCPIICGLESVLHGRACFSHQIGQCRGACIGLESPAAHQQRLLSALHDLRLMRWPFDGPVALLEESEGWQQMHLLHLWSYLGSLDITAQTGPANTFDLPLLPARKAQFDADTYKILHKPLHCGRLQLETPPAHWVQALETQAMGIKETSRRAKSAQAGTELAGSNA